MSCLALIARREIERVHALSVSVEIKLKMDWQGCKKKLNCQILHLIDQWHQHNE